MNPSQLIAVETSELTSILQRVLERRHANSLPITKLVRRPSAYASSYRLEELEVTLAAGHSIDLILKDLGRDHMLPEARHAKPEFLHDVMREIAVYDGILDKSSLGAARYDGAIVEPDKNRHWLLIERIRGSELYQVGEVSTWQAAARWIAHLHDAFPPTAVPSSARPHLLAMNGDFFRQWPARALRAIEASPANPSNQAALAAMAARYDRVVDELLTLPQSFIHGEYYAANILTGEQRPGVRIVPVDWEMAGVGPSILDLASLVSGRWGPDDRAIIVREYWNARTGAAMKNPERGLSLAQLHQSCQWLGWATDWRPPAGHAQDWLDRALMLGQELGVI